MRNENISITLTISGIMMFTVRNESARGTSGRNMVKSSIKLHDNRNCGRDADIFVPHGEKRDDNNYGRETGILRDDDDLLC